MTQRGEYFTQKLVEMGRLVRGAILSARARGTDLAGVTKWTSADAIYELDSQVEPVIEAFCEHWSKEVPLVLIAEGIGEKGKEGKAVFPRGSAESAAQVRIIMDPIDGTRGLMYDKRSAWFLAGVAPNKMEATRLSDVFAAVQVELPVSKQSAADILWAVRGQGAKGLREEVRGTVFQKAHDLVLRPSTADNINHGFASISNFFPGTKVLASKLMEEIVRACIGPADVTRATVFDDQYISNGGQLYELMMGHDRFVADFRPLFYRIQGMPVGMSVHPYDMAAMLVAREAGIEITDGLGGEFDAPLDVDTPLCWAGYANKALRERIEPVMKRVLGEWGAGAPGDGQ
jgi:fructose-1,6-bisphosphatase/inositol monophosphatase family enzyme